MGVGWVEMEEGVAEVGRAGAARVPRVDGREARPYISRAAFGWREGQALRLTCLSPGGVSAPKFMFLCLFVFLCSFSILFSWAASLAYGRKQGGDQKNKCEPPCKAAASSAAQHGGQKAAVACDTAVWRWGSAVAKCRLGVERRRLLPKPSPSA